MRANFTKPNEQKKPFFFLSFLKKQTNYHFFCLLQKIRHNYRLIITNQSAPLPVNMQNGAMQIGLITLPKTELLSRFKLLFHSWVLLIPPSLFCQSTHLLSLYLCLVNALILTQISSCSLLHFLNKLRNSVLPHGHFSLAFLDFNPAWTWGLMIWDSSLRRSFGKAVALSRPHQVPEW